MSVLTTKQRNALPSSEFALPGGRFPIPDASHARNALARAHYASPAEQATIRAKVHAQFPGIGMGGMGMSDESPLPNDANEKRAHGRRAVARAMMGSR